LNQYFNLKYTVRLKHEAVDKEVAFAVVIAAVVVVVVADVVDAVDN